MLRRALLWVGVVMLFAGVVALVYNPASPAWALIIPGGLLTLAILLERVFYKPLQSKPPGGEWVRTTERFVDPDSGKTVDVFHNPSTGERQYVARGESGGD
jgi:hypothetical protein